MPMQSISIRYKILLWAGLCLFFTLGIVVAYSTMTTRDISISMAQEKVLSLSREKANEIAGQISVALNTARTLAHAFSSVRSARAPLPRERVDLILRSVLEQNPDFVGVYSAWEPNAFDGLDANFVNSPGSDQTGRYIPYWNRNKEGRIVVEPLVGYEDKTQDESGARKGDYYLMPREAKQECIIEPYIYPVQGKEVLMTSLVVPVLYNGVFHGILGVDLALDFLQAAVDREDIFSRSGKLYVISYNGRIAAAGGNPEFVGQHMKVKFPARWEGYLRQIKATEERVGFDGEALTVFSPMVLGKTRTPWSVLVEVPKERVVAAASAMMWRQIEIGMVFTLAALLGLWGIARAIARPIGNTVHVAQLIAKGELAQAQKAISLVERDLSSRAGDRSIGRDETRHLLDAIARMTSNLASLLEQVQGASAQLVSVCTEIAATSKEQGASVQAFEDSTVKIVTAVKEISATAQELAKTMESVRTGASETATAADIGREDLNGMERTMKQLAESTTSISLKLGVIHEKAGNINEVVTTITKVADRTNLLSLNAAIEAERAGEYGLGFAVVAQEIRRLADQTAAATLDIERMVQEMQSSVSSGVVEMEKFSREVNCGVQSVAEIGSQMAQIIERVKELSPRFDYVTDGMKAQSQGGEQIREEMVQLSEGAKQMTDSLKQSNEATEQLREAARALQAEVARFRV
jgi:methyl-accepting chemotaxis protein